MLFLHLADHVSLFSWFCFSYNVSSHHLTSLLSAVPFCQSVILEVSIQNLSTSALLLSSEAYERNEGMPIPEG